MPENVQQVVPLILLALALIIAFWLIARASRTTKIVDKQEGDVLDEGAAPAARNQALIDKAPAAKEDAGTPLKAADPVAAPSQEAATPTPAPAPTQAPAPTPAPTPAATTTSTDDLRRIKGLGPKLVTILAEQDITSFAQIAGWNDADIERVDATLGRFKGRITRDQWVEQAKLLAAGDEEGFSETFGNNG